MAYRTASAIIYGITTNNAIACTVPAGTVAGDYVLVVTTWSNASGGTVTVSGASTVVAVRTGDGNLGWAVHKVTGVVAGGTITVNTALNVASNKEVKLYVFDADIGVVGSIAKRAVSQAFQVAPALTVTATAKPVLVFAMERTTATGTTLVSAVSSGGETVSTLNYETRDSDPDVSFYLGRFTNASDPTGTVTVTFSGASGNGIVMLISEAVVVAATPTRTATFTIPPAFTAIASDPNSPAVFRSASALVHAGGAPSVTVPAGTVASDFVYLVVAWGSPTVQVVAITGPTAGTASAAAVVPSRADANLGWTVIRMTGLVAGDVVATSLSGSGGYVAKLFSFDKALDTAGPVGRRTGSAITTTIPTLTTVAGRPVYLFALERTLTDGTAVAAVSNANGTTVTQQSYDEYPTDPDISFYLGKMTPPTGDSGATTLTYSGGSGNGAGVAFPTFAGPITLAPTWTIAPSFAVEIPLVDGLNRAYLGRPEPTVIRVKTRTTSVIRVQLAVSTNADMSAPRLSESTAPDAKGYAALEVTGLVADTAYYWQVWTDNVPAGTVHQARTWPTPGVVLPVSALLAGACTAGYGLTSGPSNPDTFTFMRNMLDGNGLPARLWIDLGDDIYPCQNGSPNGPIMPQNDVVIRNWWETQHQGSQRKAFHAAIPTAHTYSDNDFVGSNSDSTRAPAVAAVVTAIRRQVLSDGPFAATDGRGLYWSALLGRVLLIHTDGRTYSSDVMLPNSTPGKTMLGATQKTWLKTQFSRSDHAGIIWFHDNQWVGGATVSTGRPAVDNWQAFSVERQELADFITSTATNLLLYVHGDNHGMAFDNGTNNAFGGFPWVMVAPVYQDAQTVTLTVTGDRYPDQDVADQKYFTFIEIADNGVSVTLTVRGINVTGGIIETLINGRVVSSAPGSRLKHSFFGAIRASDVQ